MDCHLNLIKTEYKEIEKRIFPRFPFTYLTFKGSDKKERSVFEVKDISFSGMQLCLKNGGHSYVAGHELSGDIRWKGANIGISGTIKWVKGTRLGVLFSESIDLERKLKKFLSVENIIAGMRPVHDSDLGLDLPANLKYWLRADGPVELFVWQHIDGELSKFQFILLNNFLEWKDGVGLRSGRVISKEDFETPLSFEDEFVFEFEDQVNGDAVGMALGVIDKVPESFLNKDVIHFLRTKIDL